MFAHLVLLLGLVYKPLTQLFWSQPKPPLMAHSVPLPCEDSLLVAGHPPRLLLRHEVGKVPNMLAWSII